MSAKGQPWKQAFRRIAVSGLLLALVCILAYNWSYLFKNSQSCYLCLLIGVSRPYLMWLYGWVEIYYLAIFFSLSHLFFSFSSFYVFFWINQVFLLFHIILCWVKAVHRCAVLVISQVLLVLPASILKSSHLSPSLLLSGPSHLANQPSSWFLHSSPCFLPILHVQYSHSGHDVTPLTRKSFCGFTLLLG